MLGTENGLEMWLTLDYNEEWIVDSGCSHHATGNETLLSGNETLLSGNETLLSGNETLLSDIHPHCQKKTVDNSMHPVTKE